MIDTTPRPHAQPAVELGALLEALPFEAAIVDDSHRVLFANTRAQATLLGGTRLPDCECVDDAASSTCPIRVAASASKDDDAETWEPASGSWHRISARPFGAQDSSEPTWLVLREDTTAHHQTVDALARSVEHLAALDALLREMQAATTPAQALQVAIEKLLTVSWLGLDAAAAAYLLEGGVLVRVAQVNLDQRAHLCARVAVGECLCGQVARDGRSLFASSADPRHTLRGATPDDFDHLILPLDYEGQRLGVVALFLTPGKQLEPHVLSFLEAAMVVAAEAVVRIEARMAHAAARARAMTYERLSEMGLLSAGIAHDFNNLLTVITGYAQLVSRHLEPSHTLAPQVQAIVATAARASRLTRQLLMFSRRSASRPTRLDLSVGVEEMWKLIARCLGEDVTLERHLAVSPPLVLLDPVHLEQILVNVAVNARDAMPNGGTFRAETTVTVVGPEGEPRHPRAARGEHVALRLTDTGCGMSPEVLARVFEPFFTTKGEGHGTGLGLPMVKDLVLAAGGHIHVHSEPGQGTSVELLFPALERQPSDISEDAPTRRPRLEGRGERLLVVEDDDSVRELLRMLLADHGYEVDAARDGQEAALRATASGAPYDLLLCDVVLQHGSGPEVAAALTEAGWVRRVAYMSGHTELAARHFARGMLPTDLLAKPLSLEVLLKGVKAALEHAD